AAEFLSGGNIEREVNSAVDATPALLGGRGPEAGVRAGHAGEAVSIPVDLEGDGVGPEEGSQDRGGAAPLGASVRWAGGTRGRRVGTALSRLPSAFTCLKSAAYSALVRAGGGGEWN